MADQHNIDKANNTWQQADFAANAPGLDWAEYFRGAETDDHSPEESRVDTVRNFDAWYGAFDVQPGDKLYLAPADRVQIW